MRAVLARALLSALALTGCLRTSDKYCELHGADDRAHCPLPDAAVGGPCTSTTDCAATPATPVCDVPAMMCVACLTGASCLDPGKPVCTTAHVCDGCTKHTDCPDSLACLPDGSCAATGDVAYVDGTNGAGSTCTFTTPCSKVGEGVSTGRPILKLTGMLDENVSIMRADPTPLIILADPLARLFKNNGVVFEVRGASKVEVYDLHIGTTLSTSIGVSMPSGTTGSLKMRRVTVTNQAGGGMRIDDGHFTLLESSVIENLGGGLEVGFTVASYDIRNNFIIGNGRSNGTVSAFGGAWLQPVNASGKFQYNTVVGNDDGSTQIPGVQCNGTSNSAVGNLVAGNAMMVTGSTDATQFGGTCMFGNTAKFASAAALGFRDATGGDYHLTATTPTTILDAAGDCSAFVTSDVDGDARPSGPGCDLGADEFVMP